MTSNLLDNAPRQGAASAKPHSSSGTSFLRRWGLQPPRMRAGNSWALAPEVPNSSVKRVAFLAFLMVFALVPLWAAQVGYSPRAKQIGMHLKCLCRGCDMSAGGCAHPGGAFSGPCDTAKSELREVDDLLGKGMSEQQIIDAFVAKYGSIVYVEPPKKGFGLVAWLMPIFYSLAGLALVVFVVRKWAHRAAVAAPAGPSAPNEALDRVRAQVDRETED